MKANELRIGNIVSAYEKIDNENVIVLSEPAFENMLTFRSYERFYPVPISEWWLLRLGFEKKDINGNYSIGGYFASFDADYPMWLGVDGCCQKDTIKQGIKYVHQLQNLYFALTGNELISI